LVAVNDVTNLLLVYIFILLMTVLIVRL